MLLQPMLYQLVQLETNNNTESYTLCTLDRKFKTPVKVYGSLMSTAIRAWNSFAKNDGSSGILLTGDSGAGKSLTASLISNIAIDSGIPVIYINSIQVSAMMINYLKQYRDVVIFIDEFSKLSGYKIQETLLSFLSDQNAKRLFILTENSPNSINGYILNRPGRVRYHINYDKLEKCIIREYCADAGCDEQFVNELEQLYDRSVRFSFDQLQTLVSEHIVYPDDKLSDLVKILNLHELDKPIKLYITKIIKEDTNEEVNATVNHGVDIDAFKSGTIGITFTVDNKNYYAKIDDMVSDIDNEYILSLNGFKVVLSKSTTPILTKYTESGQGGYRSGYDPFEF